MEKHANLIAGEWIYSDSYSENISPADLSDCIGRFARATSNEVDRAIDAALNAQPKWAALTPNERANILDHAGRLIEARASEIGRLLAREEGKTLMEATGEAARAGQIFRFFAGECLRQSGDLLKGLRPGIDIEVRREAVGVIGMITPWNFPIAIPAWKLAPALAFGNAVVMKPAEIVPASVHAMTKVLVEAGIPAGVFNLVMGPGREVGQKLTTHPDIRAISFTGSVSVGRGVASEAISSMKKIQLEMGGKNPLVVLNDADLERAADIAIQGGLFSTGQRCTASSRIIVEEKVFEPFCEIVEQSTHQLKVGNPLEPDTQIGPVVSESQLLSNLSYVERANEDCARVEGGKHLTRSTEGHYMSPALFVDANPDGATSREEIFGPCMSLIRASDFEHALALANDTEFGLSAGICTASLSAARKFKSESRAGMIMVNQPTAGVDFHVPFGGIKGSSYGSREQGRYAIEFYTNVKTIYESD